MRPMRLFRRLAYWLRLESHDAELMDEVAFHREMLERDLVQRGMSRAAARDQARRTLGNDTLMREEARSVWLWSWLEALRQDVRYTLRDLRRNPVFTAGVMLTLALGIGANAAMFSLVDRLLFRAPAMMVHPETVHRVNLYRYSRGEERETGGIYARYRDIERWSTSFSQTSGIALKRLAVGVGSETQLRNVAIVSAGFFGFFNAPPVIGRYYTAAEDEPPTPAPVAVLSQRLWETQFASRRDVVGRTLQIDAVAYTIIGVAPDEFVGLWPYLPPAAFVPVATFAANRGYRDWTTTYVTAFGLDIIARRKPDVSVAAASADLTNALRRSYQTQNAGLPNAPSLEVLRPRAVAAPVLAERGPQPSSVTRAARWLSGVTVIVLLIACANVANLLLARTIRRRREVALRIALGVSRQRLFAQLLTEGILLALLGAAAGLVLATWGASVLRAMFLPGTDGVSLLADSRTLLFAGGIALGAGVLTGLTPLIQMRQLDLTGDLKSGPREGVRQRRGVRTALVLVQCALSVILLVGAGLCVQSLRNVRDVRLGFDADSVLLVSLNMRDVTLDSAATVALRRRLLESVQQMPGVAYATLQESVPFDGETSYPIVVDGIDSTGRLGVFDVNKVSADYFKTMGTRIVRGRAIAETDVAGTQRVAVVGESMAAVLWPGEDAIGRCFRVFQDTSCTYVVGVAQDIRSQSIDVDPKLHFYYLPAAQWRPQEGGLFVRARGNARALVEPVRTRLQRNMPGTSFVTVQRLGDIVDATLRSWIVGARVFTGFGVLALILAAVGLYSVIAYNVTQRRQELGIRLALGATRPGIVQHVVLGGFRLALAGVVIGGAIALVAGRWIEPLLYRLSPYDPRVYALGSCVLLVVAAVAGCIPAFRAASVDPRTALQAD